MPHQSADDEFVLPDETDRDDAFGLATAIHQADRVVLELDHQRVELPPSVREGLARVVAYLSQGSAVAINPVDEFLSTQQAARLIGVSRPHVVSLLEAGGYDIHRATGEGSHRRIALRDILALREQRLAEGARRAREQLEHSRDREAVALHEGPDF